VIDYAMLKRRRQDDRVRLGEAKRLMRGKNFSTLFLFRVMRESALPFKSDNTTNRWVQRMVRLGLIRKLVRGLFTFDKAEEKP
jgi:hypothetical protein